MTATRTTIILAGAVVALGATLANAQQEHWLTYRTAQHPAQFLGHDLGSCGFRPSTDPPDGVDLPELIAEDPLFAKWVTPLAPDGGIWLIFDRSRANSQRDRLYIDSNCDGSLADETVIKPFNAQRYGQGNAYAQFSPVEVWLQGEDGPVAYALSVQLHERNKGTHFLRATTACWYQGQFELAGKMRKCVLVDYNCNGVFDDSSANFGATDRIRFGGGRSADEHFVGKYTQIDGKLFHLTPAQDGAFITLAEAQDVTMGAVKVPDGLAQLTAGGKGGLLRLEIVDGVGQLPIGEWAVHEWRLERKDEKGVEWQLVGKGTGGKTFQVVQDEPVELAVGEPVVSAITHRPKGKRHSFSQSLKGRLGEHITLTRRGQRPPAPKLQIVNEDRTYDKAINFEYG